MGQRKGGARGPEQTPGSAALDGGHAYGVKPLQVLRFGWFTLARQLVRAADQQGAAGAKVFDYHAAAVVQGWAHAQGHIETLFHQVYRAVADPQVHRHLGVTRQEDGDDGADGGVGQRDRAGHTDSAAWFGLRLGYRLGRGLRFLAYGHAVAVVKLPDGSDRQFACSALQQAYAEPAFKLGHAP